MLPMIASFALRKAEIRKTALSARRHHPDHATASATITSRLMRMPEYRDAGSVLWYVNSRHEVGTREAIGRELDRAAETSQPADGPPPPRKQIVVPYCVDGQLRLFHLRTLDQLGTGEYRILEPKPLLREAPENQVSLKDIDLIIVPGVAFDPSGGRLGHGRGYYDRLLASKPAATPLIALAFDCQVVDSVPMQPHDIRVDRIVTESRVISP